MRERSLFLLPALSMLMITVAMTGVVMAPGAATRIYVDPPSTTEIIGEYITIDINVADITDLSSWEFWLRCDNTILEYSSITEGPFLKSVGATYFIVKRFPSPPAPTSYISVGCMLMVPQTASGSGVLATIEFLVIGEGSCTLDVYDTKLLDSNVMNVPHDVEDGYFSNTVIGDLVRRSAWPEHHHFVIAKDEDHIQTLYAKVKNLGEGYGFLRLNFTVWMMDGDPEIVICKHMVGDVETRIAPDTIVDMTVDLWASPDEAWEPGKYYVDTKCLYSADGLTWKAADKTKSFSFAIVL